MRSYFLLCLLALASSSPIVVYVGWGAWDIPTGIKEAVDAGFNVINLEFWMNSQAADTVGAWANVPLATKKATLDYVHSKGAVLIMSVGGGTDHVDYLMTVTSGTDYGTRAAKFAKDNLFDGVDLDLEFSPGNSGPLSDGSGIKWIVDCHKAVRAVIGSGSYLTHAPQAPYFGTWAGAKRGYVEIYKQLNGDIDWLNVQFYNQGAGCYTTYDGLFSPSAAKDNVKDLIDAGIPANKIVLGKYYPASNGGSGFIEPNALQGFMVQAKKNLNWNGGFMVWGYKCNGGMDASQAKTWGSLMQSTFGNSLPGRSGSGTGINVNTGSNTGTGSNSGSGSGSGSSGSGSGSGSAGTGGKTTTRCGSSWGDANTRCGQDCVNDGGCAGSKCWADLSLVPCQSVNTGSGSGTGTKPSTGSGSGTGTKPSTGSGSGTGTKPSTGSGSGTGTKPSTGSGSGTGTKPSTGTGSGTGTKPSTGTGSGSGSGSPPTNTRCGTSWVDADTKCGKNCKYPEDCPAGNNCFASVSMAPCAGRLQELELHSQANSHKSSVLSFGLGAVAGVAMVGLVLAVIASRRNNNNNGQYVHM